METSVRSVIMRSPLKRLHFAFLDRRVLQHSDTLPALSKYWLNAKK